MNKTILLLFLSLFLFFQSAKSQLAGNYSIGDSTCTFQSFQEAIDSLIVAGTAGNVAFKARPGNYNGFSLSEFTPTNLTDTVFFQSESSVANDVVIRGLIQVSNASLVRFQHLRFEPVSGQQYSCVDVSGDGSVFFDRCSFINPYSNCFTSQEALFSTHMPYTTGWGNTTLTGCLLTSPAYTVYLSGARGSVKFQNDTISGAIDCFTSGVTITYDGNIINLTNPTFRFPGQIFRRNTFNGGYLYIQGDFFDNLFYCEVWMTAGTIYGNRFFNKFTASHIPGVRISDNVFEQSFSLIFSDGSMISRNEFYGEADFTGGTMIVTGNFFYGYSDFASGPNYQIIHNNFHPDATLRMTYTSGKVANNNLGNVEIWQIPATTITNNNFIPHESASVNVYGTNPFFYNPGYISVQDLHATNPALTRKSTPLEYNSPYRYDFDSIPRKAIPTIGANEICFNFQCDTISLKCDSLCLDLCSGNCFGYYWSPSSLFSDSAAVSPVIHPASSVWVYLKQAGAGTVDSVFLDVTLSAPEAVGTAVVADLLVHFTNMSVCADSILWDFGDGTFSKQNNLYHAYSNYGWYECKLFAYNSLGADSLAIPLLLTCLPIEKFSVCGDSLQLETCLDDFTGYYWSPSSLFSDSTEANPVIFPESNVWIYLRKINSDADDLIVISVYPSMPEASFTYTVDSLTIQFSNSTKCADSLWWDFGDGTTSNERDPLHTFAEKGLYNGKLLAFSLLGCDTAFYSILLTEIETLSQPTFEIWPNPAHDFLVIDPAQNFGNYSIEMIDLSGQIISRTESFNNRQRIELTVFRPGIYIIRIQAAGLSLTKKLVIR